MHTLHEVGVSKQIGVYSDAVEVAPNQRWLFTAGTPGLALDGSLAPDIEGQSHQMWKNIDAILKKAGMSTKDIVKINTTLINEADIKAYVKIRAEFLDGHKPAFMLAITPSLIRPGILVEVEVVAAKAA